MTTETGTVKWFNEGKGFGFIAPDGGGKDLFAHFKEIQGSGFKTLTENQRVQFEVTQGHSPATISSGSWATAASIAFDLEPKPARRNKWAARVRFQGCSSVGR